MTIGRRVALAVLGVGLAVLAHLPVLGAGATGRDLAVIAALAPEELPLEARAGLPAPPGLVVAASLRALLATPDLLGLERGVGNVHAANFLLLLALAVAAGHVARAALSPWLGGETAAAAGRATALLVPLHPLAGSALGALEAHGLLIACAAGATATALFLRARQRQEPWLFAAAFGLLALSASAGRGAAVFVLWFVLLEWTATRRHRPVAARGRSTATTLLACSAVVAGTWILLGEREPWALPADEVSGVFARSLSTASEKLGVLLLPGPTAGAFAVRLVVLGVLLLIVVHPAFLAARSAPRLWGWFALAAGSVLVAGLLLHPRVRVVPGELGAAFVLLPAEVGLAVVLAASATAVAGVRRVVLPALLALSWTVHAREVVRPWPAAAARLAELGAEARRALDEQGAADRLWFVDLPAAQGELEERSRALPWILHPGVAGRDAGERARSRQTRIEALDGATLARLAHEPEFSAWRAQGLVLLLPAGFAGAASADGGRWSLRVAAAGAPPAVRIWRTDGASPPLACEPLTVRAVRATKLERASTAEAPRLAWRARDARFDGGSATGVWVAGASGVQAWFDLSDDPRWILGRELASVWFEGELVRFVSAELLAGPPSEPARVQDLEIVGDDWLLTVAPGELARPLSGTGTWSLGLLDVEGLTSARFPVQNEAAGRLRALGAEPFARTAANGGAREVAWVLEYRSGAVTLHRSSGRRRP